MGEYTIRNLPDLLSDHLGPGKEIIDVNIKKLPQNGYGSIMLRVDLKTRDKNGSEEEEHLVAKVLHDSEMVREMFKIQDSCKNENAFYEKIIPILRNFQKENGIENGLQMFPKFYGARINLDGSDIVNDDSALILENLVESGLANGDRKLGFDFEAAKVILADLAEFQGTAIAFIQKHPQEFNEKIKPHCKSPYFNKNRKEQSEHSLMSPLIHILRENPETVPLAELATTFPDKKPAANSPYASIYHGDLWVNNMMEKVENGKIVKNVFVDFQGYDHKSCAGDVFFFLWTSVQRSVLQTKIDELIAHYHECLVDIIRKLKGDTSPFSLEKFYDEIKTEAEHEFRHSLMFAFGVKHPPPDFGEMLKKGRPPPGEVLAKSTPEDVKDYLCFMTLECNKRGWLY